jgi:hypothetical protein
MRKKLGAAIQECLSALVRGEGEPFVWGRHDCVLWPANIHVRAGLPDPVPQIRGKYRSMLGAYRLMGEGGIVKNLERTAKRRKWKEIEAINAEPGDIGIIESTIPMAKKFANLEGIFVARVKFCVIRGPHGDWHGPIDKGFSCYPDRDVLRAWNVLP